MKLRLALALFLCVMVGVTAGCANLRGTPAAEPGEASAAPAMGIPLAPDFRIADIPLPAGFEFDRKDSFVFQNSAIDVGAIQYHGKEKIGDVAQFYLDEMPRYNWTLINITEYSTVNMYFDKPAKSCQVTLVPRTPRGTVIQITFFPKEETMMQR